MLMRRGHLWTALFLSGALLALLPTPARRSLSRLYDSVTRMANGSQTVPSIALPPAADAAKRWSVSGGQGPTDSGGIWLRHESCQFADGSYDVLAAGDGQWCQLVTDGNAQSCLDRCLATAGCEAVNFVPLVQPADVKFKDYYNLPPSAECHVPALESVAASLPAAVDTTAVMVCYGFRLQAQDYEDKAIAHNVDQDPMDAVSYSTCYRHQDAAELAALAAEEAVSVKASTERLWTAEQLRLYGAERRHHRQILLAVIGEVFDVTRGRAYYGAAGGNHYQIFAGRDGSRAFSTGDFTQAGATDSLDGLTAAQVSGVIGWLEFYREEYMPVGKLVGRYFDNSGQPTAERGTVLDKAAQVKQRPPPGREPPRGAKRQAP